MVLGAVDSLEEAGIRCEQTTVGDRFVYECMRQNDYCLGGEQSGHIIISKYGTTGDGIMTFICFENKPPIDITVQIECILNSVVSRDPSMTVLNMEEGNSADVQALVDGTSYNVPNAVLNGTPTEKVYDFTVV